MNRNTFDCGGSHFGERIEYRNPRIEEVPELKQLWQICFGDSKEYVDYYFENAYESENTFILADKDKIHSMQTLLPACLSIEDKVYWGRYVYAVATYPQFRGLGCMKRLSEYAQRQGEEKGEAFFFLVPAGESLFNMYASMGYSICSYLAERSYNSIPGLKAQQTETEKEWIYSELSEEDFLKQRKQYMRKLGVSIDLTDKIRSYSYHELHQAGCSMIKLHRQGNQNYLIYYLKRNMIIIRETDLPAEALEVFLPRLFAETGCTACQVRLSAGSRESKINCRPYGMIKFLTDDVPDAFDYRKGIYANLMLD